MQETHFALHAEIEENHWWFMARRRIIYHLIKQIAPPSKDSIVVDIGCGTGANIAALGVDYNCVGIDPSAEGIQLARKRFPDVSFICGFAPRDLGDIMYKANFILLMDVLEHVPDDFLFFSEILSQASAGVHILLTVPANLTLWSEHDVSFGHYRRYERERFERIWSGLPVTARLVSHYNSRLYPLIKIIRVINRLRGQAGGKVGTDFSMPSKPVNSLLENTFAGEMKTLARTIDRYDQQAYLNGVSLIAILRRETGRFIPRTKPNDIQEDYHESGSLRQ